MSDNNASILKIFGVILMAFGLVYAMVGTLAFLGSGLELMPGHKAGEMLVVALAYLVALVGFIGGVACLRGKSRSARMVGLVIVVVGAIALVYELLAAANLNFFDCLAVFFGVALCAAARE